MALIELGGIMDIALQQKQKRDWLTNLVKQTNAASTFLRVRDPSTERNYDYDKLSTALVGKHVRIEYYSTIFDRGMNCITGCYKQITGTVTEVIPDFVTHVVLDNNKCFDPYSGTDFKIEVLS